MLGMLGEAALRTLLLAVTVQVGLWMFRVHRAQLLLVAWTVVLAASLAMPVLQWAMPFRLPMLPGLPAGWLIGAAGSQPQAALTVSSPGLAVDIQSLPTMGSWSDAAYLLVSSVMAVRLAVGVALSLRLLSKAVPLRLASAPTVRIRISRAVAAPVTVGNVILLPPDVVDWPPAMRQAAIAHESAHIARGDFALLVFSQLNRALFWFSPVSWLLHRRLAALAELASDDHAMTVTGDRTGYAEVLLEMGRRSGPLLRGLAMARASTLRNRIERVLSEHLECFPVSGLQRSMIVVGAAIVSVAAASPDFNPGALPISGERERLLPFLTLSDGASSLPVQTAPSLSRLSPVPPQIKDATRPASQSAAPIPREGRARLQPASGMQMAARPVARPVAGNAHVLLPARATLGRNRAYNTQGDVAASSNSASVSSAKTSPSTESSANHAETAGPDEARRASHPPREGRFTLIDEPSLLKVMDQQTCSGVYLPGAAGGAGAVGGPPTSNWGALNIIRGRFFREADGRSWLKFYLGVRDPVDLPVTVTGEAVEFTAGTNTSFKVLPQGTNHLTGTSQRPDGTIDFACGKAGVHLFDRKS